MHAAKMLTDNTKVLMHQAILRGHGSPEILCMFDFPLIIMIVLAQGVVNGCLVAVLVQ